MTNEKVIDKAFGYVDAIAQKLGVAAEHVWPLMVQQQRVDSIIGLIFGVVMAVAAYILLKQGMKDLGTYDHDERGVVLSILGGIATLMALLFIFLNIGPIINPEYYAIREILDVISGD